MNTYTIYDNITGRILRHVSCPYSMALLQLGEAELLIEGYFCHREYKIENGSAVALSGTEKNAVLFSERENTLPPNLDTSLTDTELNSVIDDYFLGLVDVPAWRVENYKILRETIYRTRDNDVRDAKGKINDPDGDQAIIDEGHAELSEYYEWRKYKVKARFPKE